MNQDLDVNLDLDVPGGDDAAADPPVVDNGDADQGPTLGEALEAAWDEHEPADDDGTEADGALLSPDGEGDQPADDQPADDDEPLDPERGVEHWSEDDRAFLKSLPNQKARDRVVEWRKSLERGYQTKFNAVADVRKLGTELDEVFTPLGIERQDHGAAIKQLVAAEQTLRTDPIQGLVNLMGGAQIAGTEQAKSIIQHLAAALKVDGGGSSQADPSDPLAAEVATLKARIAERDRADEQARTQQTQQAVRSAQTKLQEFAQAKAEDGKLKHPHFEKVKSRIGALLHEATQVGQSITLEDAYQQAVWSRADLRDSLMREQAKKTADQRRNGVAKAKAARSPKTASVPAALEPEEVLDTGSSFERLWDEAEQGARH